MFKRRVARKTSNHHIIIYAQASVLNKNISCIKNQEFQTKSYPMNEERDKINRMKSELKTHDTFLIDSILFLNEF